MERYKDKQLSAYERAAALADTLSTEEQAQQLKYDAPAIEKAGLPSYNWWNEGLHGVARAGTATVFPQAIALAAAFDKDILRRFAADRAGIEASRNLRAAFRTNTRHKNLPSISI